MLFSFLLFLSSVSPSNGRNFPGTRAKDLDLVLTKRKQKRKRASHRVIPTNYPTSGIERTIDHSVKPKGNKFDFSDGRETNLPECNSHYSHRPLNNIRGKYVIERSNSYSFHHFLVFLRIRQLCKENSVPSQPISWSELQSSPWNNSLNPSRPTLTVRR